MRVRRGSEQDWRAILNVLEQANFHRLGGPEMRDFPVELCFVAEIQSHIAGVGGYRMLERGVGKTTLLAVASEFRGTAAAECLQRARLEKMFDLGAETVFTNCDDERVIRWNCQKFGFRRTGVMTPKEERFGREDIDCWTQLVLNRDEYKR